MVPLEFRIRILAFETVAQASQGTEWSGRQGEQFQARRPAQLLIRGQEFAPDRKDQRPPFFARPDFPQRGVIDDHLVGRVAEFFQDLKAYDGGLFRGRHGGIAYLT